MKVAVKIIIGLTVLSLVVFFCPPSGKKSTWDEVPKKRATLSDVVKVVEESAKGERVNTSNIRFKKAFNNLIKEEGGYVNDPDDPGGETKYGISKRSYPKLNIQRLTLNQAANIYRKDFYDVIRGDELPTDMIAQEVLEQSVNMGIKTAVSFLQIVAKSMGASMSVDGKMGPQTLKEIAKIPEDVLLVAIKSLAVAHYLELAHDRPPMRKYLNGWIRRVQT